MPRSARLPSTLLLTLVGCVDVPGDGQADGKVYPTRIGGRRSTQVFRPADFQPGETLPAVVMLHGYSSWGADTDVIFGLHDRVDRDRFLLVMPGGTKDVTGNRFWNATDECCNWFGSSVDDVGYLAGLVEELRAGYDVGTLAVVGHSNGAYMGYRLACDRPDVVDRLATFAGAVPLKDAPCTTGDPIPLLHVHGTYDEVIAYDANDGYTAPVATVGAVETVRRYAARQGCATTTHDLGRADLASTIPGEETVGVGYDGCPAPVALWSVDGGYHLFTDATDTLKDGVAAFALGGDPVF